MAELNGQTLGREGTKVRWLRYGLALAVAALIVGLLLVFLTKFYPVGVDWQWSYAPLSDQWRRPYAIETFTNPPWVIALVPHAWLPLQWGNAINLCLNILLVVLVVRRFGGGWPLMLLVFTSPPFLDLVRTNNVDWIPMLALLLPPPWGLPLLAIKPQAVGGVALIWWKRGENKIRLLLPLAVIVILSLVIWGLWPTQIKPVQNSIWNFAPWPFAIPLGLYMLFRAYRLDDEFLAAAATPFLVPYIAPYSLVALLAFSGSKYRREAFFVYAGFWIYFIVETRRIELMF